jgi:periodic tryptophan protein 1
VPRGFAAEEPKKYVLDDQEFERISKLAQLQLDDARDQEPEKDETGEQNMYEGMLCVG